MPVKICGIAAGSITLVNNCRLVRPRLMPARISCSGTERIPAALASTVKLNDATKISRIFDTSPMPKYRITRGNERDRRDRPDEAEDRHAYRVHRPAVADPEPKRDRQH